jgi:hypothetical protein
MSTRRSPGRARLTLKQWSQKLHGEPGTSVTNGQHGRSWCSSDVVDSASDPGVGSLALMVRMRMCGVVSLLAAVLAVPAARADDVGVTGYPAPPLVPGQSVVTVGVVPTASLANELGGFGGAGSWTPLSGMPTTVTLWSHPLARPSSRLNAYVAFQPVSRGCAPSPARDRTRLVVQPHFYELGRETELGDGIYDLQLPGTVVINQREAVRVCMWFSSSRGAVSYPNTQVLPLLNDAFGATVSSLGVLPGQVNFPAFSLGAKYRITDSADGAGAPDPVMSGVGGGLDAQCAPPDTFTFDWGSEMDARVKEKPLRFRHFVVVGCLVRLVVGGAGRRVRGQRRLSL